MNTRGISSLLVSGIAISSANATDFLIGNIINQTGPSNTTQAGSDNSTMNSVIEEARNTNATSFAADSIINQTQPAGNTTVG